MSQACLPATLRRVYWETTAGCNLRCIHCRRTDVLTKGSPEELDTPQAKELVDQLARMGRPVLILSGGEPVFRRDIFEIAAYARDRGLPLGLATNGTLIHPRRARALKESGIYYASVSFDGARPSTHDAFRGKGAFVKAMNGFLALKEAGIQVQVNFTVTRRNIGEVEDVYRMAASFGAVALYLFLLVPVGCGVRIAESDMLGAEEVDAWLRWVLDRHTGGGMPVRAICAPHYFRLESERTGPRRPRSPEEARAGCLAGIHMCFISHKGDVYPCGYLPISCGNVTRRPLREIWETSPLLSELRDPRLLGGRCGRCPHKLVCGGCRARAFYAHSDFQAEEPYCSYQPMG